MGNYKMVFSYDGSRYKGWQKLGTDELTIQGLLETLIGEMLNFQVELHGSGRTDAGVHAKGQVANMKVPFILKDDFRERLNEKLPEDICVLKVEKAESDFRARYSATGKTYRYLVDTNEKPCVFMRKYTCHYPERLDLAAMRLAAAHLLGTYDFTSFTDDKVKKNKVRTIYDIQIIEEKGILHFVYRGDGFLQHMIRILTGTLLEVGTGKFSPNDIKIILESKERAKAGFMAPAKGLFLEKVDYN